MKWQQIKDFVNGLNDQQLRMDARVVESIQGQLGVSFPLTDAAIHQGRSDEFRDKQPFLTMPEVEAISVLSKM